MEIQSLSAAYSHFAACRARDLLLSQSTERRELKGCSENVQRSRRRSLKQTHQISLLRVKRLLLQVKACRIPRSKIKRASQTLPVLDQRPLLNQTTTVTMKLLVMGPRRTKIALDAPYLVHRNAHGHVLLKSCPTLPNILEGMASLGGEMVGSGSQGQGGVTMLEEVRG
jgi:hypothetical protein